MAILSVWQIEPACRIRQNSVLWSGFESSGPDPEWCCKEPDRSLDRPCGLLTRVFPPALRAAAGQARREHATHLRLAHAEDAGDLPHGEHRAGPLSCHYGFVHRDRVVT